MMFACPILLSFTVNSLTETPLFAGDIVHPTAIMVQLSPYETMCSGTQIDLNRAIQIIS